MVPYESKTGPAGPMACKAIAHTMIGHFATRLEVEARKAGGSLTADDIRALAERFLAEEHARFTPTFRRSYETCSATREAAQWHSSRRRPFDRLLMHGFAHLYPPRSGDDGEHGILSRRCIPGFKLALIKMVGPALYEQCQMKAQAILDRHRLGDGSHDWHAAHEEPESRALVTDVLVAVAHYFGSFEKRREWFCQMVNANLDNSLGSEDEHWRLTNHGFAEMMHALFADLRITLIQRPDEIKHRHGEHAAAAVSEFLTRLDVG